MRFDRTCEQTKRRFGFGAVGEQFVDDLHVRILLARVFEPERLPRCDVCLSAESDAVAKWFQIVDDAFDSIFDDGVVRVRAAFHGIQTGVDVVARG